MHLQKNTLQKTKEGLLKFLKILLNWKNLFANSYIKF